MVQDLDEIKLVCRDANITQLYGACYKDGSVLLVEEYMEVRVANLPCSGWHVLTSGRLPHH